MFDQDGIRELISKHKQRLYILTQRQVVQGMNTPPETIIEIQEIETEIARLEKQLLEDSAPQPETNKKTPNLNIPKPSPFIDGGPVPPSHFVGRNREVGQILGQLANPARSCSAVSGDPRVGKTSLLHYLLRMPHIRGVWGLSSNWCHFVYIDCQNISPFNETAFWRHILRETEDLVKDDEILKAGLNNLLQQDQPDIYDFNSFFDKVARAGRLIVLMLDEFEWVIRNLNPKTPGLLNHLRALLNRPERGLALLIATRVPLGKLCAPFDFGGSPFDNCFASVTLIPFDETDCEELFFQYQVDIAADERLYLSRIAGNHPYLIQLTGLLITQARGGKVDPEVRQTIIEAELEYKTESYFQDLFNNSSQPEQFLLALLALQPLTQYIPDSEAKLNAPTRIFSRYDRELNHLKKRGLVRNGNNGGDGDNNPQIFSPIFARWLLRKILIDRGSEMLLQWEPHYARYLSRAEQQTLKKLIEKLKSWPEVVKDPALLEQAYQQDEAQSTPVTAGEKILGRYVIEGSIGGGGMADVFKAHHVELNRIVAIKKLRPALSQTKESRTRFQQEAQVVAGLRHPHIVQVFDFGMEDNLYYMVMEFIEGYDLKKRLQTLTGQPMDWDEALRISRCIADALDYAHGQQIIHRDVKPANILLTDNGDVFLVDFGLVRLLGQSGLTQSDNVLGTLNYMAPEQLMNQGQDIDHRADIYALGSIVYEMFTGRPPFEEADFPLGFLNIDPPAPSALRPDLPQAAGRIMLTALAKDPAQRPETAAGFIDDLRRALRR